MVFNSLHLVTAYLHLRPCEALLIPQHAKLWMPQHHSTFCSLFPGMPFPSFVHGKLQFILQHAHHKSQPGCCFFFLHILGIAQHSIITLPSNYPYYISLMPFECLIWRDMSFLSLRLGTSTRVMSNVLWEMNLILIIPILSQLLIYY